MTNLPETIKYSMQLYTHGAVLGNLHWVNEHECINGNKRVYKVLRATVIEGTECGYLFGQASKPRDMAGETISIYGVKDYEIDRGHIIQIAM